MFWIPAATMSLLIAQAYASPGSILGEVFAPRGMTLEARLEGVAMDMLERRQSIDTSGLNLTSWNMDTAAACTGALSSLPAATNPSGIAACYNIPKLDTNVGSFMADLRLYQVATPFGEFSGIAPQQVQGGVLYNGATVSLVSSQDLATRDTADDVLPKRDALPVATLLQTYMFVGQINKDRMVPPMTLDVLEPLVAPVITLTGKNAQGQTVSTNVSSNEAIFVNGIFAHEVVQSNLTLASIAANNQTAGLQAGTVAFVLPGVTLMIFPVGLVITGIWTVIGVAVYGYGTYQRYNYRESYRSRKARAEGKPGYSRI